MRNLKRVLSLALATVMLLGMMVIGAGAADAKKTALTDLDKVVNQEAVTLLVDLGLIGGKPDGSFAPTEVVDRATMAKLITIMMMGDVDQNSFKGATTDLTDIDGNWAEGYIKFCYSNKIISGDGQGHFNPSQPVTTAAAAKMLLVAIGYVSADRGYEGASWSLNIMRDAQGTSQSTNGLNAVPRALTKGTSVKSTDPLTRDNAAQMIFNTLFVDNKSPIYQWDNGKQYISKYEYKPTMAETTFNGLTRNVGILTAVSDDSYATTVKIPNTNNAVLAVKDKVTTNISNMGKMVAYYTNTSKMISTVTVMDKDNTAITVPGNLVDNADKATHYQKWLSANGLAFSGLGTDQIITDYVVTPGTLAKTNLIGSGKGLGNYAIAYVVDADKNGTIDAMVKTTKTVSEVTGAVKTKTDTDGKVTVSVPGVTAGYVKAMGADGLEKGDLVMHIKAAGTTYITKCETVTGKITGFKSDSAIYVDGTSYPLSSGAFGGQTVAQMAALDGTAKKDAKIFLDENKNVLYAKLVDGSSAYNVAVVLGYDSTSSTVEDTKVATARLLMADGTIVTVDVANTATGASGALASDTIGTTLTLKGTLNNTSAKQKVNENFVPVAYSVDGDGKYTLTTLSTTPTTLGGKDIKYTAMVDANIAPNKAAFNTASASTGSAAFAGVGNANTVFAVSKYNVTTTKFTGVDAYTGIAAAPKFTGSLTTTAGTGAYGIVIDVDGTAGLTFVVNGNKQDASATSNYIYIPDAVKPSYSNADKTWSYVGVYMNGEKVDIVSKTTAELTKNAVMKVSLNDAGQIIEEHAPTAPLDTYYYTGTGISYASGVATVNTKAGQTKAYYTLADDAKVFEIAKDGTVTEVAASGITADKTDKVEVLGASDMNTTFKAKYIYITKAETNTVGLTVNVKAGTGNADNAAWSAASGADATTNAKTATATVVSGSAATHAITYTLKPTDGAMVSVIGVAPATTSATGTSSEVITYKVTSEDNSAVCFYKLTLVITAS